MQSPFCSNDDGWPRRNGHPLLDEGDSNDGHIGHA
jgi:hypothetical protein